MLEQIEILGTEVVPVLRREFDAVRQAGVPDAPTHAARVAVAREAGTQLDEQGSAWKGQGARVDLDAGVAIARQAGELA